MPRVSVSAPALLPAVPRAFRRWIGVGWRASMGSASSEKPVTACTCALNASSLGDTYSSTGPPSVPKFVALLRADEQNIAAKSTRPNKACIFPSLRSEGKPRRTGHFLKN